MKLKDRVVTSIKGIRTSGRRFPLTLLISAVLVIFRIYMHEIDLPYTSDLFEKYNRISMVLGMGILLSLSIGLLSERLFREDRFKQVLGQALGLGFLLFYYLFLLKDILNPTMIRYAGTMIFLMISFFYSARLGINKDYENYTIDLFESIIETIIYAFVLLMGIFIIIFTIDQLFDVNMDGKYYYYVFLLVYLIFAVAFLISKLPRPLEDFTGFQYRKSLSVLLTYIVIPLISIYSLILYVYFAKIIIQWNWPKGLVSHLVLWYSSVSVGVIFLISPIVGENKIAKNFKTYFPKLVLPILLMMFISIGQRVNQYGITENRYYILALGLWVTAMMVLYSSKWKNKNIIIPISLSLVVLNSVYGPLSSMAVSKYSQNHRLKGILEANGMLEGKKIIAKTDIEDKPRKEINNIIKYFKNNHSLEDVKLLEKDFSTSQMKNVFGFAYRDYESDIFEPVESVYYNLAEDMPMIDIADYDYYLEFISYLDNLDRTIDNIRLKQSENGLIEIFQDEELLISRNLSDMIKDLDTKFKDDDNPNERKLDEMTYEFEEEKIKIKLIFKEISGRIQDNGKANLEHFNYILLIKKK